MQALRRPGQGEAQRSAYACALSHRAARHWWYEGVDWLASVSRGIGAPGAAPDDARRSARASRARRRAGRSRRHHLGRWWRPAHLDGPQWPTCVAGAYAELRGTPRNRTPSRSAPCGNCWRCRPAIGVSGDASPGRRLPAAAGTRARASATQALNGGAELDPALRILRARPRHALGRPRIQRNVSVASSI